MHLTPQESQLVNHLGRGFTATRLTGMHQLAIANITSTVTQLKHKGFVLTSTIKLDSKGRRYAEYSLDTKTRKALMKAKQLH